MENFLYFSARALLAFFVYIFLPLAIGQIGTIRVLDSWQEIATLCILLFVFYFVVLPKYLKQQYFDVDADVYFGENPRRALCALAYSGLMIAIGIACESDCLIQFLWTMQFLVGFVPIIMLLQSGTVKITVYPDSNPTTLSN